MGIIAGQQRARTVEIMNSFEVSFTGGDDAVINEKFYAERQKQCTCRGRIDVWALAGAVGRIILVVLWTR